MFSGHPLCDTVTKDVTDNQDAGTFCVHSFPLNDMQAAFIQWAINHPEEMKTNGPDCMTLAFKESFPCREH
jgi:hypothetical protein